MRVAAATVRARLELSTGRPDEALASAVQAVAGAEARSDPEAELDALLALIEVQMALGRADATIDQTVRHARDVLHAALQAPTRIGNVQARIRRISKRSAYSARPLPRPPMPPCRQMRSAFSTRWRTHPLAAYRGRFSSTGAFMRCWQMIIRMPRPRFW